MNDKKQMNVEEKKRLNYERQKAVREAWNKEKSLVQVGQGTRDWSQTDQKQLIDKGRVKGYDGHHMKSVSNYPQYAGESENIQFLTEKEHFEGAHKGDYHSITNGYYNPKTQKTEEFRGNELKPVEKISLSKAQYGSNTKIKNRTGGKKMFNFRDDKNKRKQQESEQKQQSSEDRGKAFRESLKVNNNNSSTKKNSASTSSSEGGGHDPQERERLRGAETVNTSEGKTKSNTKTESSSKSNSNSKGNER